LHFLGCDTLTIRHGDRIVEAAIAAVRRCMPIEIDELSETARGSGGFGSTGVGWRRSAVAARSLCGSTADPP
jgi:dUTP pyrophosphatase